MLGFYIILYMEEMKLSRRYSITAAIQRCVVLKITDRHDIICHVLDVFYPRNRHQEKCLQSTSNFSM